MNARCGRSAGTQNFRQNQIVILSRPKLPKIKTKLFFNQKIALIW